MISRILLREAANHALRRRWISQDGLQRTMRVGSHTAMALILALEDASVLARDDQGMFSAQAPDQTHAHVAIDRAILEGKVRLDVDTAEPPSPLVTAVDRYTRRLWHTSQHDKAVIWLGGRIQEDVHDLRAAFGLPGLGWNDSVPDEEVGRCSVHIDGCAGQHTHTPPIPHTDPPKYQP